jgi:DNA-binding transcriptional LysR family regulator
MGVSKTTLEQWAILAEVIDRGGFAQAAASLNRSQSAVSYTVGRLQESLGIPLLTLAGRKSVLTAHGRTLLARARSLIHDLETLEALARSLARGWEPELKLVVDAAFPRSRLLEIIAELQASCPGTQMQLSDAVLSGAEDAITKGLADIVITTRVPPGFLGDRLLDVEFIAVARSDHALLALQRKITADDLVQVVVRDSGTNGRDEGWLGSKYRFTVSSMEASLATILAGLAYAWLPEPMIAAALRSEQLKRLPLDLGSSRIVTLYLVLVRPELVGPAGRAAVEAFARTLPVMAR